MARRQTPSTYARTERVYPLVIRFALAVFRVLDLRFEVHGAENLPPVGGAVVAINHLGYLDFALAGVPAWRQHRRLIRFMAKHEVFAHPVSGPLMRGMHHIPVDRAAGAAAYREAIRALRSGELVGVFPEATISRSIMLKEFKTGAARMAAEAGVPVVPMIVWGGQRLLTKGRPPRWVRHVPIVIRVGEPLEVSDVLDPGVATKELFRRMTGLLADAEAAYPERPGTEADRWWLPAHLGGAAPTLEAAAELDQADADQRALARGVDATAAAPRRRGLRRRRG